MPARARTARVAFALVALRASEDDQLTIPAQPSEALLASIVPGTAVERYGRIWRMAQFQRSDEFVTGRIGFESAAARERWIEASKDFQPAQMLEGHTSPFAIDLTQFRIAFQLRAGLIRPTTFTENFRALLERAGAYRWSVEPERTTVSWTEWLDHVSRVTELRVNLERANPHYSFDDVEELIEGANAFSLGVLAKASKDEATGLKVDEGWLANALSHAREYGRYSAKGTTESGEQTEWKDDAEGKPRRVTRDIDPQTSEVRSDRLTDELKAEREQQDDSG